MAIIGMFFQDGLTGSARGDWALQPLPQQAQQLQAAGAGSRLKVALSAAFVGLKQKP